MHCLVINISSRVIFLFEINSSPKMYLAVLSAVINVGWIYNLRLRFVCCGAALAQHSHI